MAIRPLQLSGTPSDQFRQEEMLRELNTLRAGWCALKAPGFEILADGRDVDTGLWGCDDGAIDAQFKALLQWAAASQCGRRLRFHMAGDSRVINLGQVVERIGSKLGVVGQLVQLLSGYQLRGMGRGVFEFIMAELK